MNLIIEGIRIVLTICIKMNFNYICSYIQTKSLNCANINDTLLEFHIDSNG